MTAADYDATLEAAWDAFWTNAHDLNSDKASLRQAFKNGAALIVARNSLRGTDAVLEFVHDQVGLMQEMQPWISKCLAAHPDWREVHRAAIFAGGASAVALIYSDAPIDLDAFLPVMEGLRHDR